jgi:thiol-disulfide isomerase/thioredoxin
VVQANQTPQGSDDCAGGQGKLGEKAASELIRINNLPNLMVGKTAPEIMGEDLSGISIKLSDYRGKVVLVVFWGSWCGPCMREVPHERDLLKKYRDKPFAIFAVNSDEDRQTARNVRSDEEMTWPSLWDGGGTDGPAQTAYNVSLWPTIYLLDDRGAIRQSTCAAISWMKP